MISCRYLLQMNAVRVFHSQLTRICGAQALVLLRGYPVGRTLVGLFLLLGMTSQAQTTFYVDTNGASGGFASNSSFLWTTNAFIPYWTTDSSGNSGTVAWTNSAPGDNAVLGTGTEMGSFSASLGGNITVGTVSVLTGTWEIALGSNTLTFDTASNSTLNVTLTGSGSVVKTGTGAMEVATASNYSGGTVINGGALRFSASNTNIGPATVNSGGSLQLNASSALPSSTTVTLAGGTLGLTGAFSQTFSTALGMSSGSTLDFGSGFGASAIVFANSSGQSWTGTLTVTNYISGSDSLRFGTSSSALTGSQLSAISFNGVGAQIDSNGFVSPVPEPRAYALFIGGASLMILFHRRRQTAPN